MDKFFLKKMWRKRNASRTFKLYFKKKTLQNKSYLVRCQWFTICQKLPIMLCYKSNNSPRVCVCVCGEGGGGGGGRYTGMHKKSVQNLLLDWVTWLIPKSSWFHYEFIMDGFEILCDFFINGSWFLLFFFLS